MRRPRSSFNIFATLRNSWKFFVSSIRFFSKNKDLVFFPIMSLVSLAVFLLICFFIFRVPFSNLTINYSFLYYVVMAFCFFLFITFVMTFYNAALVACATDRLLNKTGNLSHGFKRALQVIVQLFIWSVINTIVGGLIQILEKVHSRLAEIVGDVLGFTWSASTYLVLPVIVMDEDNAFSAIKKGMSQFGRQFARMISIYSLIALMFFLAKQQFFCKF